MTAEEVVRAIFKTGFKIVVGDGKPELIRPDGKGHIPGDVMRMWERVKSDVWDMMTGKHPGGMRRCEACKCEWNWWHRKDVGRLCDVLKCPVRSAT